MRINLRLLRPAQMGGGPLVQVNLDGVLFQDFSFYGPNRLDSRRIHDRLGNGSAARPQVFQVDPGGARGGRAEAGHGGELEPPGANGPAWMCRFRAGRAVGSAAVAEHNTQFAFLRFPDAPVEPIEGWAEIAGNEASNPRIDVRNVSSRQVRYVEIDWIVSDRQGQKFMAGSVPASGPAFNLKAGGTSRVLQDTTLRISKDGGGPVSIAGMTGFVGQVEFTDGKVWIPNRESLANAQLLGILEASPEERRLLDLYRKKGPKALADELGKF